MRVVDRWSPVRIGVGLIVLGVAGWLAGLYMCRCGGTSSAGPMNEQISVEQLKAHVGTLAGEIGERNVFHPRQLQRAAEYIERAWREQGYDVVRHGYEVSGVVSHNLEVTRRARSASLRS